MPALPAIYVSGDSDLELATDFVAQQGPRYHRAFQVHSRYDNQRGEFAMKPSINGALRTHTDDFLKVIRIYQQTAKDKVLVNFDIRKEYSWDDIMCSMKDAETRYKSAAGGWKGVTRMVGRQLGDNAPAILPYLKLLPDGEYTSILCGGLTLVFQVAGRMSEKRQQILKAFGEVPKTIYTAERCRENFPKDEFLSDLTIELYFAILTAIEGMMEWLVRRAGWKQIKEVLLGPVADRPLDEKMKDVEGKMKDLQERVSYLRDRTMVETSNTVQKVAPKLDSLEHSSKNIAANTSATSLSVQDIKNDLEKVRIGVDAQNGLLGACQDTIKMADWYKEIEAIKQGFQSINERLNQLQTGPQTNAPKALLTQDQLRDVLAVDTNASASDKDTALQLGQGADPATQGPAFELLHHPQFQAWLWSRTAEVLLVDGNNANAAFDALTSMSFLCATLSQSLTQLQQTIISINFFCGLHASSADPLWGASGLIRSLISQLLLYNDFNFDFITTRRHLEHLSSWELDHLCDLFCALAKQLPINTVLFCLVDGISLFETMDTRHELCFLVRKLRELTEDESLNAVFKLLLTSPHSSLYVREQISPKDQMLLPRDIGGNSQVLTGPGATMQFQSPNATGTRSYSPRPPSPRYDDDEGFDEAEFNEGNLSDDPEK